MNAVKTYHLARLTGLVVLCLFALNGCHLLKRSVTGRVSMSEDENLVRKVNNIVPDWKFLEIRMTGKAEEDNGKVGFMGTIKIEKDQQIFIMLRTTIGIELARIYATKDSVWLVSRILGIKERGDWKLIGGKIGYPIDFFAMQGILSQSLFTSAGNKLNDLVDNLVVKNDKDDLHLVSNSNLKGIDKGPKYLNDFLISKEGFTILDAKIRDINGQWIADVKFQYNKENQVKKIDFNGIDSERSFSAEINILKKDIKDFIEINFVKF